jgi:hypothetical protein
MNSNCPDCDVPLRNPTMCSCGWKLPKGIISATPAKVIDAEQRQRNKEHSRRMMAFVKSLRGAGSYEPGDDMGIENE